MGEGLGVGGGGGWVKKVWRCGEGRRGEGGKVGGVGEEGGER